MKIILNFNSVPNPKGPNDQVFIEAHDESGKSIDVGEWAADGEYETLTIDCAKLTNHPLLGLATTAEPNTKAEMLYQHGKLYVYDATSQTFDIPAK